MAATDQTYRNQRALDIVFGVTCILMLLSLIWMFADDYFREFKVEVRSFRDVEEALAQREFIHLIPDEAKFREAQDSVEQSRKKRAEKERKVEKDRQKLLVKKAIAESDAQDTKAKLDSIVTIYNIAVENRNAAIPGSSEFKTLEKRAADVLANLNELESKYSNQQHEFEIIDQELEAIKKTLAEPNKEVDDAEKKLKSLTDDFDRFAKLAAQKRWKLGDAFRNLPVIDAFASPTRIDQIVLDSLPIDYNFKHVTRYDRCTTCHQGIDQARFARSALVNLRNDLSDADQQKFRSALAMLQERSDILKDLDFNIRDIKLVKKLSESDLTDARISQFSAHPHLDLFVDGNSPHPKEKFGCTICHSGQGSATEFNLASHTPDNATQKADWVKEHHWQSNHFWDFPMLPGRFIESSCIKCHHQVLDLLPTGEKFENRRTKVVESPGSKVVKGYNLVRENGCFGCHEIAGIKSGRPVGPDLRLEPFPPLDVLTAGEKAKLTADPLNSPGTMRKVGPSLKRLTEKTNQVWVRRWLQSPRDFRPDTRMPHFYNLSNNHPDVLPQDQKDFPAAEIHGIAYYLIQESKAYLEGNDRYYLGNSNRKKELEGKKKTNSASDEEKKELEEVTRLLELYPVPTTIKQKMITGDGKVMELPTWIKDENGRKEQARNGRVP